MLETRTPPISTRTRRSSQAARSETPVLAARTANASHLRARSQAAREQVSDESIRRALPSARHSRLSRSEMRLMGLATASTAIACALLLVYLAAYAHVTQLGIEQAQAQAGLHRDQVRSELLMAQRNALESPQRIVAAAAAQGMTPRGSTPINYIAARSVESGMRQPGAKAQIGGEMASDWDQGSSGGTTEDSSTAASFHH